jgi:DNA-directed RNA polymerase specialized sigma24 family protein
MEIIGTNKGHGNLDAESEPAGVGADTPSVQRRKWSLTQEAFDSLLMALDPDREGGAAKYLELHSNLVRFFEWRGCSFPHDHADETLNRVAKRLSAGEEIHNPSGYALGVARLLLLEIIKERTKAELALKETARSELTENGSTNSEESLECLRVCLEGLPADNRELIVQYYQGEKSTKIQNRKSLVERLGIPINTLRMRALRLREKLQECVTECLKNSV